MSDDRKIPAAHDLTEQRRNLSRREFTTLTVAAGVNAATGVIAATGVTAATRASAAEVAAVNDTDVVVKTPSGDCDAALLQPRTGRWPAVILFPDIFGVRPTMRAMARSLAGEGYAVLIPNPYYRMTKAPGIGPDFDFGNPADRARLEALRAPLTGEAVMQDAAAYVAFLDAQPGVKPSAKIGVFGYCMGGPMTMQAAAARPERIGAGASFHGGGLVTDQADSPHLLVPKIKAQYYFGIAAGDDAKQPDAKTRLQAAFGAAKVPAKIEVYQGTLHGWCVKDMPLQAGKPIYDEAQAARAWQELLTLYKRALV
jgi:carboxymethylenebutenolidase